DDERQDRDVQEREPEHERRETEHGNAPGHVAACALRVRCRNTSGTTSSSRSAIATALATGQSRLLKNSVHSTWPIISESGAPSSAGMTNSPTAGMNTSSEPATMPGNDKGSVIVRKALNGRQ